MLTLDLERVDHKLKIVWSFGYPISSDLTEFLKINNQISNLKRETLFSEAVIVMIGEQEIPVIVLRSFLSLIKILLDRNMKLQFSCTSEKVENAMKDFGFSLLGKVERAI